MRRCLALCLIVCWLAAGTAMAGPWMRDPGTGFASLSREIRAGEDWTGLYAEYGLSERLTFVLDAGSAEAGGMRFAVAALRMPLGQLGENRFAVAMGIGQGWPGGEERTHPVVQTVLSWGRSIEMWQRPGWAALDATLREMPGAAGSERKLDATLGIWLRPRDALLVQTQFSDWHGGEQVRLGLGWVRRLGPVSVETGLGRRLREGRETDFRLGLWIEF